MTRVEISRVVREAIQEVLPAVPGAAITGDKHIEELGADSVDRVEILLAILGRLRLDEPMSRFSDVPDIDALVDCLFEVKCT